MTLWSRGAAPARRTARSRRLPTVGRHSRDPSLVEEVGRIGPTGAVVGYGK